MSDSEVSSCQLRRPRSGSFLTGGCWSKANRTWALLLRLAAAAAPVAAGGPLGGERTWLWAVKVTAWCLMIVSGDNLMFLPLFAHSAAVLSLSLSFSLGCTTTPTTGIAQQKGTCAGGTHTNARRTAATQADRHEKLVAMFGINMESTYLSHNFQNLKSIRICSRVFYSLWLRIKKKNTWTTFMLLFILL